MSANSWEKEMRDKASQQKAGQSLTIDNINEEQPQQLGSCVWFFHKPVLALDVEDGGNPTVTFQYVYISVRSGFKPDEFYFVFDGLESWKLVVRGTNLRPIYDRINEHRVRRIRKADRPQFGAAGDEPFIQSTEIIDVTPKRDTEEEA